MKIADAVKAYLDEGDWNYKEVQDGVFGGGLSGDNSNYQFLCITDEESRTFRFYLNINQAIPDDKRPLVSEFLTRANYGLMIGNFELDFTDGEVRYKTSTKVLDGELSANSIDYLIGVNLHTIDRYFPGIMKVCYSDASPEVACALVESSGGEESVGALN
jgi:hypothetical protein